MPRQIEEESLRKLITSLLEGTTELPVTVNVNAEQLNNDHQLDYIERTPVDRAELANVITSKILNLKNDAHATELYGKLSGIIDAVAEKDEEKEMLMTHESALRTTIRKMIREVRCGENSKRSYTSTDEAGGTSFDEIAAEFGFAGPQGAKAAVEKALRKMKFLMDMPEDDRDFLVLSALDDFISVLHEKGDLTDADEELLRANPQIAEDLNGFKEHLHKYVLRGMRELETDGVAAEE
jgi:hypothetical protein